MKPDEIVKALESDVLCETCPHNGGACLNLGCWYIHAAALIESQQTELAAKDAEIARLTLERDAAIALHKDCAMELDRMRKERDVAIEERDTLLEALPHDCGNCKYALYTGACKLLPDGDEFSPDYTEGFGRDDCGHWEWRRATDN